MFTMHQYGFTVLKLPISLDLADCGIYNYLVTISPESGITLHYTFYPSISLAHYNLVEPFGEISYDIRSDKISDFFFKWSPNIVTLCAYG